MKNFISNKFKSDIWQTKALEMKRLAVIPTDPVEFYLETGYGAKWLKDYFNPLKFFDEVYILSPIEKDNADLLGMKVISTQPYQLRSRLKELKINVVRAYGGLWPCEMACTNKVNGIPVIVSVHDTNPKLLWDSIIKADVVLSMSQAVRRLVLTKFKNENRAWILPNRIHFDYMKPLKREDCADLEKRFPFKYKIFHVGRKVEQKNLDNLIKSLKFLGNEYCLIAVGKGDSKPYEQIARDAGVLGQCFFIEAINNEELPKYFAITDCVCMPSRWEGFGIFIIEALACEAIVVVSAIPGIMEVVEHLRNGLLIKDYENPEAIAQMVQMGCTNEEIRGILKNNSRKSVERYEQSKVDTLEVEYYKKMLEMNSRGEFKMSLYDQLLSSSIGSKIKNIIPISLKRSILSLIRRK